MSKTKAWKITWRMISRDFPKNGNVYTEYVIKNDYCDLEFYVADQAKALTLCHILNCEVYNDERMHIADDQRGLPAT
jgi:hypothetical protein